jgi:hypothetical protein
MTERACPECGKPMTRARAAVLDDSPRLGAFYWKPCEFANTITAVSLLHHG